MDFWSRIGVTQSGGSRYESGRNMPKPVRELLRLVHIERVDLAKVNRDDLAVASLLKNRDPELYASLKKRSQSRQRQIIRLFKRPSEIRFQIGLFTFYTLRVCLHICPFLFTADTV